MAKGKMLKFVYNLDENNEVRTLSREEVPFDSSKYLKMEDGEQDKMIFYCLSSKEYQNQIINAVK